MDKLNLPNCLSLARFLLALPAFYLVSGQHYVAAAVLLWVAIATDVADGYLARRWDQTSALGGFLDHGSDAVLVTCLTAGLAWTGLVHPLLPVLIIAAFTQYALDSKVLAGQTLRASTLGRYNGIAYFVLAGWPIMEAALGLYLLPVMTFYWASIALIITTVLSMADRLWTLWQLKSQ